MWLPARTPDEIVRALSDAMREAARSKEMAEALSKFGSEPAFETPAQFAETIKAEIARWGPVVKSSGFVAVE